MDFHEIYSTNSTYSSKKTRSIIQFMVRTCFKLKIFHCFHMRTSNKFVASSSCLLRPLIETYFAVSIFLFSALEHTLGF